MHSLIFACCIQMNKIHYGNNRRFLVLFLCNGFRVIMIRTNIERKLDYATAATQITNFIFPRYVRNNYC